MPLEASHLTLLRRSHELLRALGLSRMNHASSRRVQVTMAVMLPSHLGAKGSSRGFPGPRGVKRAWERLRAR